MKETRKFEMKSYAAIRIDNGFYYRLSLSGCGMPVYVSSDNNDTLQLTRQEELEIVKTGELLIGEDDSRFSGIFDLYNELLNQ